MAETAITPGTFIKILDLFQRNLYDGDKNHLCNPFADIDGERGVAAIPAGDVNLALVIGVDQAHQIAQDDAVFMAQSRPGQDDGGQVTVADMDCKAGRDQHGVSRVQFCRFS